MSAGHRRPTAWSRKRTFRPNTAGVILAFVAGCSIPAVPAASAFAQESDLVTTTHQIHAAGGTLTYIARAGYIPIRENETGGVHGNVFFVSYSLDSPDSTTRPVTFVWNGGPGSNSVLVHLVGFGPRRIRDDAEPSGASRGGRGPATVEARIEDNPDTWLAATDLVFVDPIGTGFSRPTRPEYASEFYSVLGDIASIAEFVRVYRTRFDALQRPLFLAGESYGVWRAAGVAEALEARAQPVTGVILISGGIPVGPVATDAERTAMFVPNRTAAAFYHHRLEPSLQRDRQAALAQAEQWARDVYAPALARLDALDARQRERIIASLARLTGVPAAAIDRETLAMTSPQFREALLRDEGQTLGRYDMRLTTEVAAADRAVVVRRYLAGELGFRTDLAYQGLETGYTAGRALPPAGARWDWNQAPPGARPASAGSGDGPPGGAQPWLRRAMTMDSALVAFVAAGLYDSLNSCADNTRIVDRVGPVLRSKIELGCYEGGHMMYDGAEPRRALARDVASFIASAAARRTAQPSH